MGAQTGSGRFLIALVDASSLTKLVRFECHEAEVDPFSAASDWVRLSDLVITLTLSGSGPLQEIDAS